MLYEKMKTQLENAWDNPRDNDPWFYTKMLGSCFLELVSLTERSIMAIGKKLKALEEGQQAIFKALNIDTAPAVAPQTNGNGNGHTNGDAAPPPQRRERSAGGPPGPGWVRIDAMNEPLSAEEAALEEKADMQFEGRIDETRYVRADSLGNLPRRTAGNNPAPPPPPVEQAQ